MMTREQWNRAVDGYIETQTALVGKPVILDPKAPSSFPQAHSMITEDVIKEFAINIGDHNPLFVDPRYAEQTRWGSIIAPPGRFINYIAETGSFPRGAAVPGSNFLYGGTTYEMYDVIRPGDSFTIQDMRIDFQEKALSPEKAERYRLLSMVSRRDYLNQHGKIVLSATGNVMITCVYPGSPGAETAQGVYAAPLSKPSYTDQELDALYRYYEDYYSGKYTRGKETRFWEDVSVGDEVTALVKGPHDVTDMAAFLCAIGGTLGNSATKWESLRVLHTDRDPDTRAWLSRDAFHFSDQHARAAGMPAAMVYGALQEAYISECITDWMGDDGFVKTLAIQQRKPCFHGDIIRVQGAVSGKCEHNGSHIVALDLQSCNKNGEILCISRAEVSLPAHDN